MIHRCNFNFNCLQNKHCFCSRLKMVDSKRAEQSQQKCEKWRHYQTKT